MKALALCDNSCIRTSAEAAETHCVAAVTTSKVHLLVDVAAVAAGTLRVVLSEVFSTAASVSLTTELVVGGSEYGWARAKEVFQLCSCEVGLFDYWGGPGGLMNRLRSHLMEA